MCDYKECLYNNKKKNCPCSIITTLKHLYPLSVENKNMYHFKRQNKVKFCLDHCCKPVNLSKSKTHNVVVTFRWHNLCTIAPDCSWKNSQNHKYPIILKINGRQN